ncbi:MAG: hypothetical protein IT355_19440 [Gemmatimonadaceae bacterium]|nr:hypothetical protein [Gemmatimonadaceae bacterium]
MPTVLRHISPLLLATLAACGSTKPDPAPSPMPGSPAPAPQVSGAPSAPAGGSGATGTMVGTAPAPARNRDRSTLSREEIRATQYTNLYDVIATLRGNWLRARAAESINGKSSTVQVYLDSQRLSGVEELRTMMAANVESIRYMDPIQASARWGMDHGAGAILVTTAKR